MITLNDVRVETDNKSSEAADVLRCLAVLYGTTSGECALDRDFGLDLSNIDKPMPAAQALIAADIVAKTQKYEPRASVRRIEWTVDAQSGTSRPKVVITL